MRRGRLIAVVGPSGVGKDSVMAGICAAMPHIHLVRRVITREPDLGGEIYEAVSVNQFHSLITAGKLSVHWTAHGLYYGIPDTVQDQLNQGVDCLANFSRKALADAARVFDDLLVLNISAKPETLAKRLQERGRESAADIARRLAEAEKLLPKGLQVINLSNDGPLNDTIEEACDLLQPSRV